MDRKFYKDVESYKEAERFAHNKYMRSAYMNELYAIARSPPKKTLLAKYVYGETNGK